MVGIIAARERSGLLSMNPAFAEQCLHRRSTT
jgi:hypothetical protein